MIILLNQAILFLKMLKRGEVVSREKCQFEAKICNHREINVCFFGIKKEEYLDIKGLSTRETYSILCEFLQGKVLLGRILCRD